MRRAKISGLGGYLPPRIVTNNDLEKLMDTSDEWIQKRSGIQQRHWVEPGTPNSDLALQACEAALENAKLPKEQVDMLVFATLSPDYEFPGTGCFLQEKLGLPGIATLDIRQQCTGFIYGLAIADQFIRSGAYKNVLVVGSEVHSSGLDISSEGRDVSVLFGDGAGAAVVSATDVSDESADSFIYSHHLHADGRGAKELWTPAPGNALGKKEQLESWMLEEKMHYPKMNGKKVFIQAVTKMAEVLGESLQANQIPPSDIDMFFFHQANKRINDAVADTLKIPGEKVFNTIHKYGNTTAATIPLGMRDALEEGKLQPGMKVALVAFGSGFTWGASLLRF